MTSGACFIARRIGEFYLKKNNNDYQNTYKELDRLAITKIEIYDDKIHITTRRPGLLIGKRGENVDKLGKYLNQDIHIIEDQIIEWLYPVDEEQLEREMEEQRHYEFHIPTDEEAGL